MLALYSLVSLLAAAPLAVQAWPGQGKPIVAAYYPSYNAYLLPPNKIPWDKYTHLDYFVADSPATPTTALSVKNTRNMQAVVAGAHKHGVSISIVIGGWTGSRTFSSLVGSSANRTAFAQNVASFVKRYDFDGVDLDWEYPNSAGVGCNAFAADDAANFLTFLKLLRKELGSKYRLSAAVSNQGLIGSDGKKLKDVSGFAKYLDYITLMAYDINGPGYYAPNYFTGPNAPLDGKCGPSGTKYSVYTGVKTWLGAGFPAKKLILGVPSYGYGYRTLSSSLATTNYGGKPSLLYQTASATTPVAGKTADPAGTDVCGNPTGRGGQWLFRELVQNGMVSTGGSKAKGGKGYTRYFDSCSSTPFLFNPSTKSLIAYDDEQSFAKKGAYAKKVGLAGINVFDATGDTLSNDLMKSIRKAYL